MMVIVRRRPAPKAVIAETASPVATVRLVPRGWQDLERDVRAELKRFGRVDAASVEDLICDWRTT